VNANLCPSNTASHQRSSEARSGPAPSNAPPNPPASTHDPVKPRGDTLMADAYRVLVTGSRNWPTAQTVASALNDIHDRLTPGRALVVVHGACKTGADFDAHAWCLRRQHLGDPVLEEAHRADWITHRQAAGPIRNQLMVSLGADVCVAFIGPCTSPKCHRSEPHGSHGATGCADLAEQAGIPVKRWMA